MMEAPLYDHVGVVTRKGKVANIRRDHSFKSNLLLRHLSSLPSLVVVATHNNNNNNNNEAATTVVVVLLVDNHHSLFLKARMRWMCRNDEAVYNYNY